ncbi:DNA cytosine methyltransferase [Agrobacterium tumefaciens]|nr:DNA cytosine methyltransferase [Agrobacterium tumefaciens]NTE22219.1 DNA cytosine methyltransferase [Agrobacterium tumefaciens]
MSIEILEQTTKKAPVKGERASLKKNKKAQPLKKDLKVLSLFSGCGGMDLGLEGGFKVFRKSVNEALFPGMIAQSLNQKEVLLRNTRFSTVFANDILADAKSTWSNHFGKDKPADGVFHKDSIVDLVKRHQSGEQVFPEGIDIVTGGFPCQDFSLAGKRNGFNSHKDHNGKIRTEDDASEETRGQLYMWMKQVIEITKPKVFIAENVKGLVNLHNVKELIQKDFASADQDGYFVFEPRVLHAGDYGVPQSRERVIFIGIKKSALRRDVLELLNNDEFGELNPYPQPTHDYNNKGIGLAPFVTVRDVLSLLPEPAESSDPSQRFYSKAKFMGRHCQGQTEVKMDGLAPTIRAEHHGNIEFRRLSAENGGRYSGELNAGLEQRRLTPRECALIQTFPSDFEFVINDGPSERRFKVSASGAYKVIGNAVPPLLAFNIANRLESLWNIYFDN